MNSSHELTEIVHAVALGYLQNLPDTSVDCLVTSPPYFQARVYHTEGVLWQPVTYPPMIGFDPITIPEWRGELGAEPTIDLYVGHLVAVFREARRVLKQTGVFWLNCGDSYSNTSTGGNGATGGRDKSTLSSQMPPMGTTPVKKAKTGIPSKNLLGIPWRIALALQADGWILRMDAVWQKMNSLPGSQSDRFTSSHEYVFQFVKSNRYYFDSYAVSEPVAESTIPLSRRARSETHKNVNGAPGQTVQGLAAPRPNAHKQDGVGKRTYTGFNERWDDNAVVRRTRRSVLTTSTALSAYDFCACGRLYLGHERRFIREKIRDEKTGKMVAVMKPCLSCGRDDQYVAHFAAFPRDLIEPLILAGCPERVCACCGKPYERMKQRQRTVSITRKQGQRALELFQEKGLTQDHLDAIGAVGGADTGKALTTMNGAGHNRASVQALADEAKAALGGYYREFLRVRETDLGFAPTCTCDSGFVPGIILDPFMGSGTTAMTAEALGRQSLGCDANPDYVSLALARLVRRTEDPQFRDGITTWEQGVDVTTNENKMVRIAQTAFF